MQLINIPILKIGEVVKFGDGLESNPNHSALRNKINIALGSL
jgi:hypothetical protein